MIFVVSIHSYVNKTKPTIYTIVATILVTAGALWAGTTDLAFDPVGYALAFTANLSTAIYLVLLRPIRDKLHLSNLQLIFVNALANIPVLIILVMAIPRKEGLLSHFADLTYSFLFLCSCAMAVIINHAIFVNTTTNDAIAQSIASQLKDVVLLVASVIFVDDPAHRADGNLQGVMVGFLGSVAYGIGKIVGRRAEASEIIRTTQPEITQPDQSKWSTEEKAELLGTETRPSS
ncbi:Nucleotide-sugar uncharacterized transporter 3 [Gracilariopsis chorda]|uniref:Nucleotide-sugar uncharacterized transporter 3 n=1 Tax=Gracilariopsis chorda TaxID=448386 RepID=A0A2V3J3T2_9FLOR|nr:Nucleotide-sugar uncharacterized transporter 3 [Gracilariopsis chorda]|eukprot:PXF49116.1 Nucleotide-sugar uncharacterized transporter 3 [Gracilariopsis chorda]